MPTSSPCATRRRARRCVAAHERRPSRSSTPGDGGHNHPTQTLTDLLTIRREKGRLDDLTVGFCGDLKFGRTVHSLITRPEPLCGHPVRAHLPGGADAARAMSSSEILEKNGIDYMRDDRPGRASCRELDILYMTRVQRERFFNEADYLRLKDSYILTPDKLQDRASRTCAILHPAAPCQRDLRGRGRRPARLLLQAGPLTANIIRMALILKLLGVA